MVIGRLRLVRRARELARRSDRRVHDLRRVERAHVVIESGPCAVPVIAATGEREHTSPTRLGG